MSVSAGRSAGIAVIVGYPLEEAGDLYNVAAVIRGRAYQRDSTENSSLPNYSVFDEKRYFKPGKAACVVKIKNIPVGITICEDIWQAGPARQARGGGCRPVDQYQCLAVSCRQAGAA